MRLNCLLFIFETFTFSIRKEITITIQEATMKKELTMKRLINIIGLFIFLGMIIMAITNPLTIDPNLGIYQTDKVVIKGKELYNFAIFLLISSFTYFLLVQLYFSTPKGRKVFFIVLSVLAIAAPMVATYLES